MAEEFSITEWLKTAKNDPKVAAQPLIIVAALAFGGYKTLYAPKVIELGKEVKKNQRIEGEIKSLESAVENLDDIKLDIEEKKGAWEKAQKLCYKKSEMTAFLRRIRELAQQSGLNIKTVNPQAITQIKAGEIIVEKFPVSFFFTGDLTLLGTFLRLIEKEEKITFISLPMLTPNASGTFEIDLTPTTILIPEIEQPAL